MAVCIALEMLNALDVSVHIFACTCTCSFSFSCRGFQTHSCLYSCICVCMSVYVCTFVVFIFIVHPMSMSMLMSTGEWIKTDANVYFGIWTAHKHQCEGILFARAPVILSTNNTQLWHWKATRYICLLHTQKAVKKKVPSKYILVYLVYLPFLVLLLLLNIYIYIYPKPNSHTLFLMFQFFALHLTPIRMKRWVNVFEWR